MNVRLKCLGVFTWAAVLSLSVFAETPTAVELLPLIPRLSSDGADLTSFQVRCQCLTHNEIPTEIDLRWRTDGRYSFLLADASTHTPIACFTDGGFAIYNALERTITFGPEVTPKFHLFAKDDSSILIDIAFRQHGASGRNPASFKLDLQSFVTRDALTVQSNQSDDKVIMSCPSPTGKSYANWEFAVSPKLAFDRFALLWKENSVPVVSITEVKTGECIATLLAPKPMADNSTIRAISWKPDGMSSFVELLTGLFHAIGGHASLTNAKYRTLKSYSHITDWNSAIDRYHDDRATVIRTFSVEDVVSK